MSFYSQHEPFHTEQPKYICVHAAALPGVFLASWYTRLAHSWPVQMSAHEQRKHAPMLVMAIAICCLGLLISRATGGWVISISGYFKRRTNPYFIFSMTTDKLEKQQKSATQCLWKSV